MKLESYTAQTLRNLRAPENRRYELCSLSIHEVDYVLRQKDVKISVEKDSTEEIAISAIYLNEKDA